MNGHLLVPGPYVEVSRKQWGDGDKWCFYCRKRTRFEIITKVPEQIDSEDWYWGPTVQVECSVCRTRDGDVFPGCTREWEE